MRLLPRSRAPLLRLLGDGDRGQPEQQPLDGGRHGARVGDVVPQVQPEVGARDDRVRALPGQTEDGDPHAVDRGARDGEGHGRAGYLSLVHVEITAERDAAPDGALVVGGRDDGHLRDLREPRGERDEPRRVDAVVVGQEDAHDAMVGKGAPPRRADRAATRRGDPIESRPMSRQGAIEVPGHASAPGGPGSGLSAGEIRQFVGITVLAVVAIVLEFVVHADPIVLFIVSGLAVGGMAHVLGVATEQAGEAAGPRVSALLNATFGNAAELIIVVLAINQA
jgi:hypothetical protein